MRNVPYDPARPVYSVGARSNRASHASQHASEQNWYDRPRSRLYRTDARFNPHAAQGPTVDIRTSSEWVVQHGALWVRVSVLAGNHEPSMFRTASDQPSSEYEYETNHPAICPFMMRQRMWTVVIFFRSSIK